MLKVVIFALLTCCACGYQNFDESSTDEYEGKNESALKPLSDREPAKMSELITLKMKGKKCVFHFSIKRMSVNDLVFTTQHTTDGIYFESVKDGRTNGVYDLVSLKFAFTEGDEIRLYLNLLNFPAKDKQLTVISRVFGRPLTDSAKEHALVNAAFADTLAADEVSKLMFETDAYEIHGTLNIKWVENVFTKKLPRFDHSETGRPQEDVYIGGPVILEYGLAIFEAVKNTLRVFPKDPIMAVKDLTKGL